jgi:uroporphyrinogen decarboxylase
MNDLFLRALRCETVERPPIWIMRQAGRYLPEYRALRARHSFQELVHTPELAAQVTHLPIDLLGLDAAILFSDILVIGEVFGYEISFVEGPGVKKEMKLLPPARAVHLPVEGTLHYVPETIRRLKKTLDVPLIGFCGGPYTVCRYMKEINSQWLDKVTDASIAYLQLQVEAGVDALQIFDSWAGLLSPEEFHTLAFPYLKRLVDALKPSGIPLILFCRGSSRFIPELVSLEPAAIGFDWEIEMKEARLRVPPPIAVQGNLNPTLLEGPLSALEDATNQLLTSMEHKSGFIFNLGHGIQPTASVENVRWLIKRVQKTKIR